jgi:acyl carrier protein
MSENEARAAIAEALGAIAPEVELSTLRETAPLRDQVDLDSMDWLRFLAALEKKLSIQIPDAAARKLVTLRDVVNYLLAAAP